MRDIVQEIKEADARLKKETARAILIYAPVIILGIVVFPVCIAGIVLLIMRMSKLNKERKRLTIYVKETVVKHYLEEVFQDVSFFPEMGIEPALLKQTGLFQMGNQISSNDLLHATYKNIPFIQADVLIQDVSKSDDDKTRVSTFFQGKLFYFDFPKKTNVYLQVMQRSIHRLKISGRNWNAGNKEKVVMENERFNETFVVYSTSQDEAFYVLTPQVMESILHLREMVEGNILLGIVDNRMYVGLHTKEDAFEPDFTTDFNTERIEADMQKLITFVTYTVDMIEKSTLMKGEKSV